MNLSIIGGGISGLCTGIYALKKGFKCTIYEKNKYLGGILNENINDTYLIYENEDFYKSLGLIDLHLETKPY
ncbi:MAG: NAD(P)-binding protein [Bacilli bacterium]|nr:NAD(P)-binding protein [Bacilli bacterium]